MNTRNNKFSFAKCYFCICLFIFIIMANSTYAQNFNLGTIQSYIKNDNLATDTNIKFVAYSNDLIFNYKNNEILFNTFNSNDTILKRSGFGVSFIGISPIVEYESINNKGVIDVIKPITKDSVILLEQKSIFSNINYIDTIQKISFNLYSNDDSLRMHIDTKRIASLKNIIFKFNGIDSLKLDQDSNLLIYTKINKLVLSRFNYSYYDSLNTDTNKYLVKYKFNMDTLKFDISGLDTNKGMVAINKYRSFSHILKSINTKSSLDDRYLKFFLYDNKQFLLSTSENLIGYYPHTFHTNIITDSIKKIRSYFLENIDNSDKESNKMNLMYTKNDSSKVYFNDITITSDGEIVITGYSDQLLNGKFNKILNDSAGFTGFRNGKTNSFIAKLNSFCQLYYCNYFSIFGNDSSNIYIKGYFKYYTREYLLGQIDSLYNKDSLNLSSDKSSLGHYSSFVNLYDHKHQAQLYTLLSSGNSSELIGFNSFCLKKTREKENIYSSIYVGATTNSTGNLIDSNWTKNTSDNANLIIEYSIDLDTIFRYIKLDGNNSEGVYNSKGNYHLNSSYILPNSDNSCYFASVTNSNSFNTTNSLSNSRSFTTSCTYIALLDTLKEPSKLLFIDSEYDQVLRSVSISNRGIDFLINTKSASFTKPLNVDTLLSDSVASSSFTHSVIISISDSLSLNKNLNSNVVTYRPEWFTYLDNNNSNQIYNDLFTVNDEIYVCGAINSFNSFIGSGSFLNGNNTFLKNDSHLLFINLGYR